MWTSNQTTGDISKVDPASRKEVDRIKVGTDSRLSSITAGFDSLWVLNVQSNRVLRISPVTEDQTPIQLDGRPSGVGVGGGRVWVTLKTEPAQLVEIDPNGNKVVDSFEIPKDPEDVRFALEAVWVTSNSADSITKMRPATHRRRSRSAPPPTTWPWAPARSGSRIARTTRSLASTSCSRASTRGCAPAAGPRAWRPTTATSGW